MFDIGWTEILVIGVVALIAIGPKDLPMALKTVGQWVAKARGLAREFQGSLDEMIRESELDKVKKEMETAASGMDVTKDFEATKAEMEKALEMPSIEMDPQMDPQMDTLATPPEPIPAGQGTEEAVPVDKPVEMPTGAIETPVEAKPEDKPEEKSEPAAAEKEPGRPQQRVVGGQG